MIIKNLTKEYYIKNGESVKALNGLNFELPNKGLVFILGKSGSGKTTLLNMLAGLDTPTFGEVNFLGKDICKMNESERSNFRNAYCGFVFQDYNVLPELTVGENILLAKEMQGEKNADSELKRVLEEVELAGYENRKVNELSGGQKQRVAIARALIKEPQIIFADEPTGALDSTTGESIIKLLQKISKYNLVVVVTHERDYANNFGDRIIELADGNIINDTSKDINDIKTSNDKTQEFKKLKTSISLKTSAKIGLSNVKAHPIRFAVALLLSVIAFTLFCIPLDIIFWNERDAFITAVYDNDVQSSVIYKQQTVENANLNDQSIDQFLGAKNKNTIWQEFTDEDFNTFQSVTTTPLITLKYETAYFMQSQFKDFDKLKDQFYKMKEQSAEHFAVNTYGLMEMDESASKFYGYTITGSYPQNNDEVAIPECLYKTLKYFGMIDSDGLSYQINLPEDLIGHYLNISANSSVPNWKKIVGVVNTNCNKERFSASYDDNSTKIKTDFYEKIFVTKNFISKTDKNVNVIFTTPKNKEEFTAVANIVFNSMDNMASNDNISYCISNDVSSIYTANDGGIVTMLTRLCLYVGIVFFIIAFLFLVNYIKAALRRQLKQIGILSAIGINTQCLLKIYGTMTTLICLLTFVLSQLFTIIFGILLNNYFGSQVVKGIAVCQFHIAVPLIMLAVLVVVALLGCVVPIFSYKRNTPAQIISRGLIK
jgi:ABC-type lipoprotein export system ATPase subunit